MVSPLASLKQGVLRPRDAMEMYSQPARQFNYWEKEGVLLKVAHGYYVHIPEAARGTNWRPEVETLALGIGQADYGKSEVALMHISAARTLGALPRALAVAVLAVPKRRPTLETTCGRIVFVKRDINQLKKVKVNTELATGWSTSKEQTVLDLARRPDLVKGMSNVAWEAADTLFAFSNKEKLHSLVEDQRMGAALDRLTKWIKNA